MQFYKSIVYVKFANINQLYIDYAHYNRHIISFILGKIGFCFV